jgi:hypothetical protein
MLLGCPVCSEEGRFYEEWEGIVWGLAFDFGEIGPAERAVRRGKDGRPCPFGQSQPPKNNQPQRRKGQRKLELKGKEI